MPALSRIGVSARLGKVIKCETYTVKLPGGEMRLAVTPKGEVTYRVLGNYLRAESNGQITTVEARYRVLCAALRAAYESDLLTPGSYQPLAARLRAAYSTL